MAAVSYDVVREILVRLKDVTTLFRCAMVCKGWCSLLVSDDSFLRRCLPVPEKPCGSALFAGFVTKLRWPVGQPPAPCFVPAPRSVLGRHGLRVLSSFFPSARHAGFFDHAVPLTSRHGLLLVCLDSDPSGVLLAVCDPLAGMLHELPRLEHYWDFENTSRVGGYALLTDSDCSSFNGDGDGLQQRTRFFKVLIVTVEKSRVHYTLHAFSSADQSGWNTRSGVVKDEEDKNVSTMLRQHNAVVCDGAARWLLWGMAGVHTLDVSCKTGHVSLIRMTGVQLHYFRDQLHDHPYLSIDGEGKLMVLGLRRDSRELEIWTSHKDGRSFQASMLKLKDQNLPRKVDVYTCLGEKHGMILIKDNNKHVYVADLKTGVMHEVKDWPRSNGLSRRKTVPWEIDWPGFFVSQLASAV
ncbi:hypothetical protein QYE76_057843 [Lolium multiflorum]|uniref:F-box domain-containing protein n=1 Tax=Lolium multiflorum TaxID=4521 RepID=A0AAD8WP54_LOLMU|nr:hypothetical protein QYE76_057843 [Lolium multiflorum]